MVNSKHVFASVAPSETCFDISTGRNSLDIERFKQQEEMEREKWTKSGREEAGKDQRT